MEKSLNFYFSNVDRKLMRGPGAEEMMNNFAELGTKNVPWEEKAKDKL